MISHKYDIIYWVIYYVTNQNMLYNLRTPPPKNEVIYELTGFPMKSYFFCMKYYPQKCSWYPLSIKSHIWHVGFYAISTLVTRWIIYEMDLWTITCKHIWYIRALYFWPLQSWGKDDIDVRLYFLAVQPTPQQLMQSGRSAVSLHACLVRWYASAMPVPARLRGLAPWQRVRDHASWQRVRDHDSVVAGRGFARAAAGGQMKCCAGSDTISSWRQAPT